MVFFPGGACNRKETLAWAGASPCPRACEGQGEIDLLACRGEGWVGESWVGLKFMINN